jgi:hypothetical protein
MTCFTINVHTTEATEFHGDTECARQNISVFPWRFRVSVVLVLCVAMLSVSGCASWPRSWSARPCCIDTKPVVKKQTIGWHLFDVTVLSQIEQGFHLIRVTRKLLGVPVQAVNLKDGWLSGSAFANGHRPEALSPEQVRWGPTRPEDLAVPPFRVTKLKGEGKTEGFFVTDSRGVRYLFKLDPPDAPELLTGAEVVSSKLLYALGYHVPSYEIVAVEPGQLTVHPELAFAQQDLEAILADHVHRGSLRVVASKILDGTILGPARFERFRDCADLRALKLAYAWVNNIDAKDHNSLLVWNGHETEGYLIDFGTSLGADAGRRGPKNPCAGWQYIVDFKEAALEVATLGWHRSGCDPLETPHDPHVGLLSARLDPHRWKPYAPNLAFEEITKDDAQWMAQRMSRISRVQIDAAVSAGRYSNPDDERYLSEVLDARRTTIVTHYLGET